MSTVCADAPAVLRQMASMDRNAREDVEHCACDVPMLRYHVEASKSEITRNTQELPPKEASTPKWKKKTFKGVESSLGCRDLSRSEEGKCLSSKMI